MTLPFDYKEFIGLYGSVELPNGIRVYNFLDEEDCTSALQTAMWLSELMQEFHEDEERIARSLDEGTATLPFPIYPSRSGLFPWGTADDGWDFYWNRIGEPENWDVVIVYKAGMRHVSFPNLSITQFLVCLIDHPFDKRFALRPQ